LSPAVPSNHDYLLAAAAASLHGPAAGRNFG